MKAIIHFVLFTAFLLLSSCQNKSKIDPEESSFPKEKKQLVNWEKMNDFEWKNQSFPLWFDAYLIDSLEIKKIQLDFLSYTVSDTLIEFSDTLPYRKKNIVFKENGEVKEIVNTEYNAAIKISETKFTYPSKKDEVGYSLPIVNNTINFGEGRLRNQLNSIEDLQQFQRLLFRERKDEFLHFIDENDENRTAHYFIIDSTKWNVSYLDLQFKPEGKDVFYYGSPMHYTSAFSLANMVEKSMKIEQERYPNDVIKSQVFYIKDFKTIRNFNYDEKGNCTGFTDSLKTIADIFLHLEIGIINYENDLPIHVSFYNEEDINFLSPIKKIRFSYFHNEK